MFYQVIFCYIDIPYFVHSPVRRHLDYFQALAIRNAAALNTVQVSVWACSQFSWASAYEWNCWVFEQNIVPLVVLLFPFSFCDTLRPSSEGLLLSLAVFFIFFMCYCFQCTCSYFSGPHFYYYQLLELIF